jgi:RNA polymerase sigma-70 factor (ECF subfamily)
MAGVAAGDPSALGALYDRHAGRILALCLRVLRQRAEAEEVLGDVFWEVWERADRYRPERGAPAAYLAMLARSRAVDRLRSRPREVTADPATGVLDVAPEPPAGASGPHEDAVASERRRRVRRALADLSPEQRRVLELSYFGGFSHSEIARALDEPLGTVKTRIRQGLVRLRRSLLALYGSRELA